MAASNGPQHQSFTVIYLALYGLASASFTVFGSFESVLVGDNCPFSIVVRWPLPFWSCQYRLHYLIDNGRVARQAFVKEDNQIPHMVSRPSFLLLLAHQFRDMDSLNKTSQLKKTVACFRS